MARNYFRAFLFFFSMQLVELQLAGTINYFNGYSKMVVEQGTEVNPHHNLTVTKLPITY